MKKIIFLFYITTSICISQDLYVSNNVNIYIYVDGSGFTDYNATTNPNAAALYVQGDIQLAGTNSIIYLRNEAQLLQSSNVNNFGTGYLERGQSGKASLYNYNYWGSPVWSASNNYSLDDILFNGTDPNNVQPINWSTAYDADYSSNPITLSSFWLYTFDSNDFDDYDTWEPRDENSSINAGLGFTMKGSGSGTGTDTQDYMFRGIPNNGNIQNTIGGTNPMTAKLQGTLIGNPYPSALDADEFILDNAGALNPGSALIFWEQATTANTHYLAQYEGRYSYYLITGGLPPTTPPEISGSGDAAKTPQRYIPVGQGFFVQGDNNGGTILFENDQRFFVKEASGNSVFFGPNTEFDESDSAINNESSVVENNSIQRVRLSFKTPEGAIRYLLLGFTTDGKATDGVDYGYDGLNSDDFPSDLNWSIDDKNYVIQGVGKFNIDKVYPLEMVLGKKGKVEISLTDLENFENEIDVFVYDSFEKTYTKLNSVDYANDFNSGTYKDRFFITFKESNDTLDLSEEALDNIKINYLSESKNIFVSVPNSISVNQVNLVNVAGQILKTWNSFNFESNNTFKIPLNHLSEGVYVLRLSSDSGTINKKVVINQ